MCYGTTQLPSGNDHLFEIDGLCREIANYGIYQMIGCTEVKLRFRSIS